MNKQILPLTCAVLALLAGCEPPRLAAPHSASAVTQRELKAPESQAVVASPLAKGSVAAPTLATTAATSQSGLRVRTVRQFAWGAGPNQLGHVLGGEQNPEAPMALDVDAQGTIYILDQVNSRLVSVRRDGSLGELPAPRTAQDLLVSGSQAWLLDRLVDKQLQRIDLASGAVLQTVPLSTVEEPGAISALWALQGDLYAELGHTELQRLAGLQGQNRAAASVLGRPSPDGLWRITAARLLPDGATVQVRRFGDAPDAATVRALEAHFPAPVEQLVELAPGDQGRIWLVADLGDAKLQRRQVLMWTANSQEPQRADLAPWRGPEETLRPCRLAPGGHLFALGLNSEGMTLQEVAP